MLAKRLDALLSNSGPRPPDRKGPHLGRYNITLPNPVLSIRESNHKPLLRPTHLQRSWIQKHGNCHQNLPSQPEFRLLSSLQPWHFKFRNMQCTSRLTTCFCLALWYMEVWNHQKYQQHFKSYISLNIHFRTALKRTPCKHVPVVVYLFYNQIIDQWLKCSIMSWKHVWV